MHRSKPLLAYTFYFALSGGGLIAHSCISTAISGDRPTIIRCISPACRRATTGFGPWCGARFGDGGVSKDNAVGLAIAGTVAFEGVACGEEHGVDPTIYVAGAQLQATLAVDSTKTGRRALGGPRELIRTIGSQVGSPHGSPRKSKGPSHYREGPFLWSHRESNPKPSDS